MRQLDGSIIAIVGLGLMGGSLAAALRAARLPGTTIRGIARRRDSIVEAVQNGFVDEGTCDLIEGVRDADIVVFGTPVRTTIDLMQDLAGHFKPGCIVSDLGSTKSAIVQAMSHLPPHVDPIGGHPMCGKEVAGLGAAEASLFQDRAYILTPLERTSGRAVEVFQEIVRHIGARCIILEPNRHDRLVAAISHLPYLLSACLVSVTDNLSGEDQMVWELASSGFQDTSRLAASEPTMMRDIIMTNQENIRQMIDQFCRCMTQFDEYLGGNDEAAITEFMYASHHRRGSIFK